LTKREYYYSLSMMRSVKNNIHLALYLIISMTCSAVSHEVHARGFKSLFISQKSSQSKKIKNSKIEDPLEDIAASEVLPSFLIDHRGFEVPSQYSFAMKGIDLSEPIVPWVPIVMRGRASGLVFIPKDYMSEQYLYGYTSDKLKYQLRKAGLTAVELNEGTFLGVDTNKWEIESGQYYRSQGVGLTVSLDFSGWFNGGKKRLSLNQYSREIGLNISLAKPSYYINSEVRDIGKISLINPFSLFTNKNIYEGFIEKMDLKTLSLKTIENTNFLRMYLSLNAHSQGEQTVMNRDYSLLFSPNSVETYKHPESQLFQELKNKLLAAQYREEAWQEALAMEVSNVLLTTRNEDHVLLQGICNEVSQVLEMPKNLWPRCRVFASMMPASFVYPSGDLFVSAGTLGVMENVDSLYFLVAHEISHLYARHTTRKIPTWNQASVPYNVLALVGKSYTLGSTDRITKMVSFSDWLPWEGDIDRNEKVQKFGEALNLKSIFAITLTHGKEAQLESQRLGFETAVLLGADPSKLKKSFDAYGDFFQDKIKIPFHLSFLSPNERSGLGDFDRILPEFKEPRFLKTFEEAHEHYQNLLRHYELVSKQDAQYTRLTVESPYMNSLKCVLGGI